MQYMNKMKAKIYQKELIGPSFLKYSLLKYPKLNNAKYTIFPGFIDVHTHLREPGFSYKEDIYSGTSAALHGGYTSICAMPNLNPIPDSINNLNKEITLIKQKALINVYPYASITKKQEGKEVVNIKALKKNCIAFSDDGKGIMDNKIMKKAMQLATANRAMIVMHCEDSSLSKNGYIHDGAYAKKHHHKGISSASEYKAIERDLKLARLTKCKYHVCHVSCKESVDLIRKYKKLGVDVTCETAPHYLLIDDSMIKEDGKYKINPPIRSKSDRLSLLKGIKDGTIDMIATDHAPHTFKEKNKGLKDSSFGASGLDIAFPILYTYLVKNKIISLDKLIKLMCVNPSKRFNIPINGLCVWDLSKSYLINQSSFKSKGKVSPFLGYKVYGKHCLTLLNKKEK